MASRRIRRTARRGLAAAVLAWVGVATASVLMAPSAAAAQSATVEIRNVTPPAASVDEGGTVTFVNLIPAQNKGGISVPLVGSVSATVYTDVAVTFFGQPRPLQPNQSTAWTFNDPATPGTISYTYRIVPQAGLTASVANQVVNTVAGQLPKLPAPTPYVVQTIAPDLPTLPTVNLPQLPSVAAPPPPSVNPPSATVDPTQPNTQGTPPPTSPTGQAPQGVPGNQYQYDTGPAPRLTPTARAAAAAFDPARFASVGGSADTGGSGRGGSGGSGGAPGSYDGASVPVFGQLAGLDTAAQGQDGAEEVAASRADVPALPAAALAAVVAL
ncbi:MAG: hypothetical protein JWQ45_3104, partial [Blastococcus sp.]|nr:hypothetical protein [Blastococcus sp.]